ATAITSSSLEPAPRFERARLQPRRKPAFASLVCHPRKRICFCLSCCHPRKRVCFCLSCCHPRRGSASVLASLVVIPAGVCLCLSCLSSPQASAFASLVCHPRRGSAFAFAFLVVTRRRHLLLPLLFVSPAGVSLCLSCLSSPAGDLRLFLPFSLSPAA